MKKRLLALLMCGVMTAGMLTGCGAKEEAPASDAATTEEAPAAEAAEGFLNMVEPTSSSTSCSVLTSAS